MYSHAELRSTAEDMTLRPPQPKGLACLPDGFRMKQVGRRFTQVRRNVTQRFIKACTVKRNDRVVSGAGNSDDDFPRESETGFKLGAKLQTIKSTRVKLDYTSMNGNSTESRMDVIGEDAVDEGQDAERTSSKKLPSVVAKSIGGASDDGTERNGSAAGGALSKHSLTDVISSSKDSLANMIGGISKTSMKALPVIVDKGSGGLLAPKSTPGLLVPKPKAPTTRPAKELLKDSTLFIQVLGATNLTPTKLNGSSDPFISLLGGKEEYRTSMVKQTLSPSWVQEQFSFRGNDVLAANGMIAFEAWSEDDFHPDDFLGQAELDLKVLTMREDDLVSAKLTLYVLKASGKKESGDFGEVSIRMWISKRPPTDAVMTPGGALNKRNEKVSACVRKYKMLPAITRNQLGTVYEEPCVCFVRLSIDSVMGLYERGGKEGDTVEIGASCTGLLGGDCPLAARAVCKTRSMVIAKLKQLKSSDGPNGLSSASSLNRSGGVHMYGNDSIARSDGFSMGDALGSKRFAAASEHFGSMKDTLSGLRRQLFHKSHPTALGIQTASTMDTLPTLEEDEFFRGDDGTNYFFDTNSGGNALGRSPSGGTSVGDEAMSPRGSSASGSGTGQTHKPRKIRKAYLYMEVEYAQQTYTSRMVRLDVETGTAHIRQDFVFAAVKPLGSRPVMVGVYVTLNKKKAGRLVGQFTEDVMDLVRVCERADADAVANGIPPGAAALRKPTLAPEYQLPLVSWPLDEGYNGVLRMHLGVADTDFRAAMYEIPTLQPMSSAVAAADAASTKSGPAAAAAHARRSTTEDAPAVPSTAMSRASGSVGGGASAGGANGRAPQAQRSIAGPDGRPRNEVERWVAESRSATAAATLDAAAIEADELAARNARASGSGRQVRPSQSGKAPADGISPPLDFSNVKALLATLYARALIWLLHIVAVFCQTGCSCRAAVMQNVLTRLSAIKVGDTTLIPSFVEEGAPSPDGVGLVPAGSSQQGQSPRESLNGQSIAPTGTSAAPSSAVRVLSFGNAAVTPGTRGKPGLPPLAPSAKAQMSTSGLPPVAALGRAFASPSLGVGSISGSTARTSWHAGSAAGLHGALGIPLIPEDDARSMGLRDEKPKAAPKKNTLRPVGTLTLKLDRIKVSMPGVWYFSIVKLGPQWVKVPILSSDMPSPFEWKMTLPIYDPADTMTIMTFYQRTQTARPTDVYPYSRSHYHISNLTPNVTIERHYVSEMLPPKGKEEELRKKKEKERKKKEEAKAKAVEAAKKIGATPGTRLTNTKALKELHTMEVAIALKLEYYSWAEVAEAYVRPAHPDSFYILGLDGASQEVLERQHNRIIAHWLEHSHPQIHHTWVREMLANRRQEFSVNQIKENFARVKAGLAGLGMMADGFEHIKSFSSPVDSLSAWAALMMLLFYPSLAVPTLLMWLLKVIHSRRHLAGMPPFSHKLGGGVDEDDDEDLEAPTAEGALARLKRQYEQAVSIALLAQNYLDDIAVVFERFHALVSWADPAATIGVAVVLFAVCVVVYLLGWPLVISAVGCWLMRPPFLRDPMPAPPFAFFERLPAALGGFDTDVRVNRLADTKAKGGGGGGPKGKAAHRRTATSTSAP